MTGKEQSEIFRECKKSASSYISLKKFVKNSERRLCGIREMISEMECQLIVLKNAESALAAQIDKITNAERKEI